jgi:hypothetical protein
VPLVPCLGIYFNFVLCTAGVGIKEWIFFLLFEISGVLFYLLFNNLKKGKGDKL